MLELKARISAFEILGRFLSQYQEERSDEDLQKLNKYFLEEYKLAIEHASAFNNWFSKENIEFALQQWSEALTKKNLEKWIGLYSEDHFGQKDPKTIALIMAGNIPLVGFHDFICVLLSGHKVLVKPSGDDNKLLPFISQILVAIEKSFAYCIAFADGKMTDFDAVIATGSDNSSRYFDYYFSKYPHVIRKNRTSVALLDGTESKEDLELLGEDIFRYFGLGCRNVSKVYLPEGFDTDKLFEAFFKYKEVIDNKSYGNNYDYNRAIFLMEKYAFYDNGFLLLRENESLHAPGAVLHYEFYSNQDDLLKQIDTLEEDLQCVVGKIKDEHINFGKTQTPQLWDYADHVDIIRFLRTV